MTILPSSKPFARGVTQLMYVGDDDAVEKTTAGQRDLLIAGACAIGAIATKGHPRMGLAAIALYFGYRARMMFAA
jgi:hypothetical protein